MAPSTTAARLQKIFAAPLDSALLVAYIYVIASASGRSANGRKATIMKTTFSLLADRRAYEVSPRASVEHVAPSETHEGGLQVQIRKAGDWRTYWVGQRATSAQNIPGLHRVS